MNQNNNKNANNKNKTIITMHLTRIFKSAPPFLLQVLQPGWAQAPLRLKSYPSSPL